MVYFIALTTFTDLNLIPIGNLQKDNRLCTLLLIHKHSDMQLVHYNNWLNVINQNLYEYFEINPIIRENNWYKIYEKL